MGKDFGAVGSRTASLSFNFSWVFGFQIRALPMDFAGGVRSKEKVYDGKDLEGRNDQGFGQEASACFGLLVIDNTDSRPIEG